MGLIRSYGLRLRRKRLHLRAWRKRRDLFAATDRTATIAPDAILLVATLRNERVRLPFFLKYYRDMGVDQFLIVDNGSDDGSAAYLAAQPDVSLWTTGASYRAARFGMDWATWLHRRHCHGHWCLTVDVDEFLIYPFCETRPLRALTDWLDTSQVRSFSAMLLDMYGQDDPSTTPYREGQDPFQTAQWFDSGNYSVKPNQAYGNLWIQGGPRARVHFADDPTHAPALNKVPLVRWHRDYAYLRSTHMLLPRGLNLTFERSGGEKASGCLLHAKFLEPFATKVHEEASRGQHYAGGREYQAYRAALEARQSLWCRTSEKYINWRQLEILGLMSKGNWA